MMMAAAARVQPSGRKPNTASPSATDQTNSIYMKGATSPAGAVS